MTEITLLLGMLLAIALLATIARQIGIPYPILMVVGGLGLGLLLAMVPGIELERFNLEPDLVFLLFLPPLLFSAAYFTSIRDFRRNLRPIGLLAVGLVVWTTLVVAFVARLLVPELPFEVALALGAIVSPPDAVATTAVMRRVGAPRRILAILEGESLVNDATALVALRFALAGAAAAGLMAGGEAGQALAVAFPPSLAALSAPVNFAVVAVGGVLIGLAVGMAFVWIFRRLVDPPVEVTLSLLIPYLAYLPAEQVHVSGVLAAVAAGLVLGRHAPRTMTSETRLLGAGVWQMFIFLLNGFVFVLIGLQLPVILGALSDRSPLELLGLGAALSVTVIVVRIAWVFPATYLPRLLSQRLRERDPMPAWRHVFVVSWSGLRGIVSLAAALSLAADVPYRDLVLFLTFSVILATLVGQGLSLPWLMRRLGVTEDAAAKDEESTARAAAAEAALSRIGELERQWPDHQPLIDQLRGSYEHRAHHMPTDGNMGNLGSEEERELIEHTIIRRAVLDAERDTVVTLRDRGIINDEVLRRVERDIDLEELRMEA